MAFSSIIDDTRRMNAKMIAMGQSVDIQKMPRPKVGTQAQQRQAMYTPSGSDVEKMLYPKNFKPRTFESEEQNSTIIAAKENEQMAEEIQEQTREPAKIIGDDAVVFTPKSSEEVSQKSVSAPVWERCRHYKAQGDRAFCKEYLGWCVKEKCKRPQA